MRRGRTVQRDWRDEDGSTVLWTLGLSVMILMLGVLTVDLWQVLAVRSEVAGRVDAAVAAGASGVNLVLFRESGAIELDRILAADRARLVLPEPDPRNFDDARDEYAVIVTADRITVRGTRDVQPVLLRLLAPGAEPLRISVERSGEARLDG